VLSTPLNALVASAWKFVCISWLNTLLLLVFLSCNRCFHFIMIWSHSCTLCAFTPGLLYLFLVCRDKSLRTNSGCLLVPAAKRIILFPDRDCSQKTAISSLRRHIFIRLLLLAQALSGSSPVKRKGGKGYAQTLSCLREYVEHVASD